MAARLAENSNYKESLFSIYISAGTLFESSKDSKKALKLYLKAMKLICFESLSNKSYLSRNISSIYTLKRVLLILKVWIEQMS